MKKITLISILLGMTTLYAITITGKIDKIFMGESSSTHQAYIIVKLKQSLTEASVCDNTEQYYKHKLFIETKVDDMIYTAMLLAKEKDMKVSLYHSSCTNGRAVITGFKLW